MQLEASEEAAWCMVQCAELDDATKRLKEVIARLSGREGYEEKKARASWRLGKCLWESDGIAHFTLAYP